MTRPWLRTAKAATPSRRWSLWLKVSTSSKRFTPVWFNCTVVLGPLLKHGARDTTVRGTALAELEAMTPRFSQWLPGEEVPEKHWMYRLAKKHWFGDFGAYREEPTARAKAERLVEELKS
jgi:hypothetical protein